MIWKWTWMKMDDHEFPFNSWCMMEMDEDVHEMMEIELDRITMMDRKMVKNLWRNRMDIKTNVILDINGLV